jgi:monoamine oxidase
MQQGIIAAYVKHDESTALRGKSDPEKIAFAQSRINEVFPGLNDVLISAHVKHWGEDSWAQCAHAIGNRNQMTQLLPEIMRSEGRIHFAGEHASAYHGWMQGAIESGARTAREINEIE